MTESSTGFRIIVIDDNIDIQADFIKVLTNIKLPSEVELLKNKIFGAKKEELMPEFHISTASQGEEGVEKIAQAIHEGDPFALAFVDIRMPPGWDGIETIKHIWEIDKHIQIVICTAYSDYSWEGTVSRLGRTDNLLILKKPFDLVAVRQLACALTKKWQLLQETLQHTSLLEERVRQRTHSLQHSLSRLQATLESSTDGILVIDKELHIVEHNKKFKSMWHVIEKEFHEANFSSFLLHCKKLIIQPKPFFKSIKELKNDPEKLSIGIIKLKDGRVFEYYSQPQKMAQEIIGRVFSFRDITQRLQFEEELHYQAMHDSLTGLPNREFLHTELQNMIDDNKFKTNTMFAVLFFDLDRFKLINDSLSHAIGDELLRIISNRIKTEVSVNDLVARLGGDEFVVILRNIKDEAFVKGIANKLIEAINVPLYIGDREIIISTSIGISFYPRDGKDIDTLMCNADAAMYQAKKSGTHKFRIYSVDLSRKSLEILEKEMQLRHAIKNNELFLTYQPQVDILSEKFIAVEALIRWNHPEKGELLPIDFIPLAEESGLIVPIGEWVLRTACQQNKRWQDAGFPPIRIAVNITAQQLNQYDLVQMVKNILNETGLNPKYLELELTENSILSGVNVINTINTLKSLGISIALDDFGTGYSSLNYLKDINIDRLKIDRSFVKNIMINRGDQVIIKAIITIAKSLNLEVLAEGVETSQQLGYLKQENCGFIQGFYFSKPLSSSELEKALMKEENVEAIEK